MKHLTEAERAYRRGALQAIQFLLADMYPTSMMYDPPVAKLTAIYEQMLTKHRDDVNPRYLGQYMDMIREDIRREMEKK